MRVSHDLPLLQWRGLVLSWLPRYLPHALPPSCTASLKLCLPHALPRSCAAFFMRCLPNACPPWMQLTTQLLGLVVTVQPATRLGSNPSHIGPPA